MSSRCFSSVDPAQAIFFDLDGTLLNNSLHQEAIVRTCDEIAAIQPRLDSARLAEANNQVWKAYWPEVEEDWTLGALDGVSVSLEAWRRTLKACGCSDDSVVQRAAQTYGQLSRKAYRLFDDVHELLTEAMGAHVPLALITNGASVTQRDKLCALGIGHCFDPVVISGEVGVAKPNSAIFGIALDRIAVEKESVWHVGDNLLTDVAGGNAAGLTTVWLNRTEGLRKENDPKPDIEISSLSDLIPLLL